MRLLPRIYLLALLLATSPAAANDSALPMGTQRPSAKPWMPESFPISFWCGPREKFITLERFQEIGD